MKADFSDILESEFTYNNHLYEYFEVLKYNDRIRVSKVSPQNRRLSSSVHVIVCFVITWLCFSIEISPENIVKIMMYVKLVLPRLNVYLDDGSQCRGNLLFYCTFLCISDYLYHFWIYLIFSWNVVFLRIFFYPDKPVNFYN